MSCNYRRSLVIISLLVSSTIAERPLRAAEETGWIRVSDGKLAVYTQGDAAPALSLLETFAQLRTIVAETSTFKRNDAAPLKIIVFVSEKQFNQYLLNAGSCAFYQQTRRSEYIVLKDLAPGHRDVSAHEFTHFLLAHSGVNLPLWLNEGLADFYSTFQISPGHVTLGNSVAGRLPILRTNRWIPLDTLFQISSGSSYYSDPEKMALFYSESWALTHMMLTSPAYAPHFPEFLQALKDGHNDADSARIAYDKLPDQIQDELRSYLDRQHLPLTKLPLKLSHAAAVLNPAPLPDAEMELALSELIPGAPAAVASESAATEESLGYLALKHGKTEEARAHFQLAVEHHSDDPNVFYYLAHLNHEAGAPPSQVLPLLDRALALQPDLSDASLELALLAAADGDFTRALAALETPTAPRPENAYSAVYTKAYCYAHLQRFSEARAAAARAQSIARNDHDLAQVSGLLDFIDQQSKDTESESDSQGSAGSQRSKIPR